MNLLERAQVLDDLSRLLSDAADGTGRVVVVRGEAGIGKTSVVRAFIGQAAGSAHILWGGCDDLLTARPLGPFWDMAIDEPDLERALESGDRSTTFRAMLELLSRSMRPTVLVIEDVHWADDATLDLIKFLGRRIERTHGLMLLTFRDGEARGDQPLHHSLGDVPADNIVRIPLQPLSRASVESLVGDQADDVWDATGGNPFFVSELAETAEDVPSTIVDSIATRVGRLDPNVRDLVEVVSVVPSKAEVSLLARIVDGSESAIAGAEQAGLLTYRGDSVSFRHELARRAVESELSESRRRELNKAILDQLPPTTSITRRAHHARSSEDVESMLELLPQAAKRAANLESHSEALGHLRALEPYVDEIGLEARADYYEMLAYEEYVSVEGSGVASVLTALDLRRQLGSADEIARTLIAASRYNWVSANRKVSLAYAEAAAAMEDVSLELRAMALSTLSQLAMLANDDEPAFEYAHRALELVGPDPSQVRVHALNNIGAAKAMSSYPDGVPELVESYEMSLELGLAHDATRAAVNIAWASLWTYNLDEAEHWIGLGSKITDVNELVSFESYLTAERLILMTLRGHWTEVLEESESIMPDSPFFATSRAAVTYVRARILSLMGATGVEEVAAESWERAVSADEIQRIGPVASMAAEHLARGGSLDSPTVEDLRGALALAIELETDIYIGEIALWMFKAGLIDELPAEMPDLYRGLVSGAKSSVEFFESQGVSYLAAVGLEAGDTQDRLRALVIYDELGATPAAAQLRRQLASEGVADVPSPRRSDSRAGSGELTARQLEVLELLSEHLTNPEIADRLFVSTRTVDHHVAAILTKLGASNRSEAVDKARTLGLL